MTHKIALVGAGRMGGLHARNAAASPRLELAAIADHDRALAERLAGATGAEAMSFESILEDSGIGAVMVASSTSSHLENVLLALGAGKAVFCEKPLSLSSDSLRDAMPKLSGSGIPPLQVAFNRRFDPSLAMLKQRLVEGEVGRLESLHIINHDPAAPRPDFIPRSGGLFRDFTIHDFDTAAWLLGEPIVEIYAAASCLVDPAIGDLGDIDTAKLVLRSASGILCLISNSRRSGYGYDQRVEVFGSGGSLRVGNVHVSSVSRAAADGTEEAPIHYSFVERYADAYRLELEHFADVLDGLAQPSTGPQDSLRALVLADAAAVSAKTGKPVRVGEESR